MNGTVHTIIGISTGATLIVTASDKIPVLSANPLAPAAFMVAITSGSVFPDLDLPGRPLGFLGHRGFTHTLVVPALLIGLQQIIPYGEFTAIPKAFILGFVFGWLMHIFADLFQKKGVPLLFPIMPLKCHVHIANIKVKYDKLFLIVYCGVMLFLISRVGLDELKNKLFSSSPSILFAIVIGVVLLKKFFGKAWKETVRGGRR